MKTGTAKAGSVKQRERLISYFAWLVGGWNAIPGTSSGRMRFEPEYEDDEAVARVILAAHARTETHELKLEIQRLKAELYDTQQRANARTEPLPPRADEGSRLREEMCEYLTKAGWQRDRDWWNDPRPELRRVMSNSQKLHEAVRMQMSRDLHDGVPPNAQGSATREGGR